MAVAPGWVALFRDPEHPEQTLMSPIEFKVVRIIEIPDDERTQVSFMYFAPPPIADGPPMLVQQHPWFVGLGFLPMMMAAGQQTPPNRNGRRHPDIWQPPR